MRERLKGMTGLERAILVIFLAVIAIDVALIATADPADEGSGETSAAVEPVTLEDTAARTTQPPATTETVDGAELPSCRATRIPERPPEPVTCRTASAQLTIVAAPEPLVLGETQVRVLDASLEGRLLRVRLRVRNESDAEQGLQAGGQELYLNAGGIRVDAQPVGDVRIPSGTGLTAGARFVLTPGQLRIVRARAGKVELGVRPWSRDAAGDVVGVVRFRARGSRATGG
jgi:hypothetical protein